MDAIDSMEKQVVPTVHRIHEVHSQRRRLSNAWEKTAQKFQALEKLFHHQDTMTPSKHLGELAAKGCPARQARLVPSWLNGLG